MASSLYGRFKICPGSACGAINHPVSRFCWHCGQTVLNERTVAHYELSDPKVLPLGKNTHNLLGGLTGEEFFDGISRLKKGQALTHKQTESRDRLEYHLAAIRAILPPN